MQRERILATLTGGFVAEIVNKLVPLFIQSFAVARLSVRLYGYAQFSYSLIDVAITLVVAGYTQLAIVELGQSQGDRQRIGRVLTEVTVLKGGHAVLAALGLVAVVSLVPSWHAQYLPLVLPLLFLLFTTAVDMSFVHIGTARMLPLSVLTISTKVLSLVLIVLLVRGPQNLLLFTMLYFGINGVIAVGNCGLNLRLFPLVKPTTSGLKARFRRSLPFALPVFLLMALERYDLFFVEHQFGPTGAGLYTGTARYVQAISSLAVAISTVFYSELVATRDRESFTNHVNLGLWTVFAVLMPVTVGAYFLGGPLLALVLPAEFAAMGGVFAILTGALLGHALILAFGLQVMMFHQRAWAINSILAGSLALGLVLALVLKDHFGMQGMALANLFSRLVAGILFMLLARSYVSRLPWRELALTALPAFGMGLGLAALKGQPLMVALVAGASLYGMLLATCNHTKVRRVWGMLRGSR